MGIALLDEPHYTEILQKRGLFDRDSSSWLQTPPETRAQGYGLDGSRYGLNIDVSETRACVHQEKEGFRGMIMV
jgi:hypothetical protein